MNFSRTVIVAFLCLECASSRDPSLGLNAVLQMPNLPAADASLISKIARGASLPATRESLIFLKPTAVCDSFTSGLGRLINLDQGATGGQIDADSQGPDDPSGPHDPGIYLMITVNENRGNIERIEPAGSVHHKTDNTMGAALSFGASKAKLKVELPGRRAPVRSTNARPEFYMYFPLGGETSGAYTIRDPCQLSLRRLDEKTNNREMILAKASASWSAGGGLNDFKAVSDHNTTFKFSAEKLRQDAYKVVPDVDLKSGEYAFVAAGPNGSASARDVRMFDFGIDLK